MRINVRVRPGARADFVGGSWRSARGTALLVAVRARAVDGAANAAVLATVAAAFGLRVADVRLVTGGRSRDKILEPDGESAALGARLHQLQTTRAP
jgi:uncharacterized protein YggU (UPF0235/DUF167 family)